MTLREKVEGLGLKGEWDYALPIEWCDHVQSKTGLWPSGIVWYYAPDDIFGKPLAVTLYGWIVLRLLELADGTVNLVELRWEGGTL